MSFKSNPVTLGTGDTTIFECPATFAGAVALVISNKNAATRTYTLKFYKASTATTHTISPAVSIAASAPPTKDIVLSLEAGDRIIGSSSNADSVVVVPVITLDPSDAAKGLTPRGEYAAGTTYAKNDLVSVAASGNSYISIQDANIGNTPASSPSFWMLNAAKGAQGDAGVAGVSSLTVVRVVSTGAEGYTADFENGDTIDGVVLATSNIVLRVSATAPERNGVYVVPASGAASRHSDFATYDSHCGKVFSVMEGTVYADTLWQCTSNPGGTLNTTAISFKAVDEDQYPEETIASATTTDIGTPGRRKAISGTTTITGLGTTANKTRMVRFSGALTLTHNATSLILPGAANILTVAGDTAIFVSDGSGNWRCMSYERASGEPVTLLKSKVIAATRNLADAAAPTNIAYTGVGFRPRAILAVGRLGGDANMFVGFTDNVTPTGGGIASYNVSGNYTNVAGALLRSFSGTAGADFQSASVASFDADGFTLTWSKSGAPSGTADINFLCLR